ELDGLRDEREAEVEMEDVRARKQPCESRPLRELPADEAATTLERPVGLGVELVAVEDDQLRVDAAPAERLYVRPRDAGRVDGTVDDAHGASRGRCGRRGAARGGAPSPRSASCAS